MGASHRRRDPWTRRARSPSRRTARVAAAEPLRGGHAALGLPVRRHHAGAAQLAREAGGDRLLPVGLRRALPGLRVGRAGRGRRVDARRVGRARRRRRRGRRTGRVRRLAGRRGRSRAAGERRGLVADAVHVGHHRQAEGRAAPSTRGAHRGARARRPELLRLRGTHARRDAAVSHDGRAFAAGARDDRRPIRLHAEVRRGRGAEGDRGRARHAPVPRADAVPRPARESDVRDHRRRVGARSSASPARRCTTRC